MTVNTTGGTPRIGLTIGSNTRYASYNSGSGTGNLKFRYTVVAADVDSDGVSIAANALSLNSGAIQDSGNTNAVITHSALAASANHKVNPPAGTAPTVTKVSYHTWANAHIPTAASATGPHPYGKALFVRFTFSEAMTFTKGWGDAARPAFARVVNGKVGTRLGVVERIAGPGQCQPFNPTLASHTVFTCMVREQAAHLYGYGNVPTSDFTFTIAALGASQDLGGTAMAADHIPTALTIDPSGPTVKSAGYYSDEAASTAITGTVDEDDPIYTKVVFSENMGHKASTGADARPHFSYFIGGETTGTQFDVVARTETLESGECKPTAATPTTTYVCLYTVEDGDTGSFDFVVGSTATVQSELVPLTADVVGNALNATVFTKPYGAKYSTSMSLSNGLNLNGLLLAALRVGPSSPPAQPGQDASPLVGKTLTVSHVTDEATGCLDVSGGQASNGQNVQTWGCNGTDAQKWTLEKRTAGDHAGRYRLVSGVGDGASYCLDNRGDFSNSDRMGIWQCVADSHGAAANQSFDLAASGDGWVLTFVRGNASSMLWAQRDTDSTSGNVGQRTGTASSRAVWQLSEAASARPRARSGRRRTRHRPPRHSSAKDRDLSHVDGTTTGCLDVKYAAAKDGQAVQTWVCNGTGAQKWRVEQRTSGSETGRYRLVSGVGDGRSYCLDNRGDFKDSDRMDIWSCVADGHGAAANQSFDLTASGEGWVLTFERGEASSMMWAERDTGSVSGNVGQRSGSESARAIWRIAEVQEQQPALSVSDATVTEAAGATLAFTVSLDRAVVAGDGAVSVDYATRDGTATAGADYTAASRNIPDLRDWRDGEDGERGGARRRP